jgi:hypothetical protein
VTALANIFGSTSQSLAITTNCAFNLKGNTFAQTYVKLII